MHNPSQSPLTAPMLAAALTETNVQLLHTVLTCLGSERCRDLVAQTLAAEEAGGMMVADGSRRRTTGGVFFQLTRRACSPAERKAIFPHLATKAKKRPKAPALPKSKSLNTRVNTLHWAALEDAAQALDAHTPGDASVKLTLIGRPENIAIRGSVVLMLLQGPLPPSLPRELPVPTDPPLRWTVMLSLRQWNRVKETLDADPSDRLMIEGYPAQQGDRHVLLAQSCKSLAHERAKRQGPQAQPAFPVPEREA